MAKLVVTTIGFDERLVIRSLLRIGLDRNDVLLLVYSKSGSAYDVERVERAVSIVKELVGKASVEYYDVVVSGVDFTSDVREVVKALKTYGAERDIIACLVGGMRLTMLEVLVSLILYSSFMKQSEKTEREKTEKIYVMREDGLYDVIIPFNVIHPPNLTTREVSALKVIKNKGIEEAARASLVNTLSRELGISKSGVYKIISKLEEKRIIEVTGSTVRVSPLGKLILEVL